MHEKTNNMEIKMLRRTACILSAAMVLGLFAGCDAGTSHTTQSINYTPVAQETSQETQELYDGYKTVCIYLNGNERFIKQYDDYGNLIKDSTLGDNGYSYVYEYDIYGNLIKDTKLDVDGASQGGYERVYDPDRI